MNVIHTPHTFNTPTLKYPTSPRNTTSYKTTRTNRMGLLHKRKIIKNMDNCSKNLPRKKYTSKWPLLCIKAITAATQKIWEIRNILKFGTESQAISNHQKRLQPTIKSYYDTYQQTIPWSQFKLFQVPLQIRLTFSPKENTQWIKTVKLTLLEIHSTYQ